MARIIAIDDDPDTLWILGATLATGGHELLTFTDPREGLKAIESQQPDALLLDVMMPGMTGWELLEIVRSSPGGEHLPTILLSAIGDSPNRARGLRLGADDFLSKPFDTEELLARVDRLLGRRQAAAEYLSGGLSSYPLSELLQNLSQSGRTGRLMLKTTEGAGRIDLKSGAVVAASFGALSETEAMVELLSLSEGEFRFYDGAVSAGPSRALALTPLLLHRAWLEDELGRRRRFLPGEGDLVCATGGKTLSYPEELAELPFDQVLEALAQPVAVEGLAAKLGLARATFELTLALLVENGAVSADGSRATPVPDQEHPRAAEVVAFDEQIRVAVTELQQLALFRGFGSLALEIEVLAAGLGEWRELAPVVASLPDVLLGEDPRLARSRLWSAGGGLVEVPGEEGAARVRFVLPNTSFASGAAPGAMALWASTDTPLDERRRLAQDIERRAGKSILLYIESGAGTPLAPGDRWGTAPEPPRSLLELLNVLAQAGA